MKVALSESGGESSAPGVRGGRPAPTSTVAGAWPVWLSEACAVGAIGAIGAERGGSAGEVRGARSVAIRPR